RTLTGVLGVIALALVWAVYRREPTASRPGSLKALAWLPLVGIALQAVVGGITVWVDLHPAVVGSHMLISLALVAVSTYLLHRLAAPDAPARPAASARLRAVGALTVVVGVVLLVLGVVTTGAGPHSGDATEPYRWALNPAHISRLHALAVWAFVVLVVVGIVLARRARHTAAQRTWGGLLAVTPLQGLVGYVQYFTGLPALLVRVHMLGSAPTGVPPVYATAALYPGAGRLPPPVPAVRRPVHQGGPAAARRARVAVTGPVDLAAAVRTALRAADGDPDRAAAQQRYMRSTLPFHGLAVPAVRVIVRGVVREHPTPGYDEW